MPEQTQNGATAGTAAGTSPEAPTQQDPTHTQPANASGVEGSSAEGNRNSGSSDGSNGGDGGDGGRERPGRAEREIKSLKAQVKELEAQLGQGDDLSQRLMQTSVSPSSVQMPDYSQLDSVDSSRIQKDVWETAQKLVEPMVNAKVALIADSLDKKVSRKDALGKALQDIDRAKQRYAVLNESDEEHYNKDLDERIGNSFVRILKADPSYTFDEHLETFKPLLEANTTASQGTTTSAGNRGTSANRSTASSRRSQKAPEDMSLDELEAYIHAQNGR
jgi:hypothetical protein